MSSLPDTLQVLLTKFASIAWNMALESMVWGLPDHQGSRNSVTLELRGSGVNHLKIS